MSIRKAGSTDRDAIVQFDLVVRGIVSSLHSIDRVLSEGICLVFESENRIVAYGSLEYSLYGNGFVSMLHVSESVRRRGVGRRLLVGLVEGCKTEKTFTSTNESNHPMRALLSSVGFRPSGVIENLDPGDPELVYFIARE